MKNGEYAYYGLFSPNATHPTYIVLAEIFGTL